MAKTVDQGFADFVQRLTPTAAQRTAGASHRESVQKALKDHLAVHSFFETGSFSHGTGVRNHSDVDVLVSLNYERPATSYTALTWVKNALEKRFPRTPIAVRRPAVVVNFGGGYETWEVIPGFITSRGGPDVRVYDIPSAVSNGGWIDSAPREHLAYVNDANKKPNEGNAKALARLIKAWKYFCNAPISSFYLEMRCAEHMRGETTYRPVWDVWQVLNKLNNHGLAGMNDPRHASGRIYACSTEAKKVDALSKLSTAKTRARKALDADNDGKTDNAFYYLNLLFGGHFPAR
jgi:predicted nucleotidyltransferase